MELIYNIYFELSGLIFNFVLYICFCLYYSSQSVINKKFKVLAIFLMLTELMDIVTAVTISYGSVIPPAINIVANTLYFSSSFCLAYTFLQNVESCVTQNESKKRNMEVK